MRDKTQKTSPVLRPGGDLINRLRYCAHDITGGPGAVGARDVMLEAADELEGVRVRGAGVATLGDVQRAQAFFAAWVSAPVTARILSNDAVQALAQAFADEREAGETRAAWLTERLEESNARLRETIGICSDIGKLMPQISDALDAYAKPPPQSLACDAALEPEGPTSWCALPRGHRGPCGASR